MKNFVFDHEMVVVRQFCCGRAENSVYLSEMIVVSFNLLVVF